MNLRHVKPSKAFNIAAYLPIAVGLWSIIFMVYVYWWPPKLAYEVKKPETHTVSYNDGVIYIHRSYCINYSVPITISRDLIKVGAPDQPEIRVALPQTTQTYAPGCHEIDRIFDVPRSTPPGVYQLTSTAVWQANPFRDEHIRLPTLTVVVTKNTVRTAQ